MQVTMSDEKATEAQLWEEASDWESHKRAQLRRMAQLPLWDKLQWLEEAHFMALHLQGKSVAPALVDELGPTTSGN